MVQNGIAPPDTAELQQLTRVARGREPADLVIRNASIVNVITQEVQTGAIAVSGRFFAAVGPAAEQLTGREELDARGRTVIPGLIDGHLHIESSLVTPRSYAAAVLPRGVTAVVWDPHEIANVAGMAGIEWVLNSVRDLLLTVFVMVPSCVPSTRLETSGACIDLPEIQALLQEDRVVGVAELMSFPDVIAGDGDALSKIVAAEAVRKVTDGHAPGITGLEVAAYHGAGVASDHECTTREEGLEKLRAGAFLMIREGSTTRDLDALLPLLRPEHLDRVGFVTDDRLPEDLLTEGGVDCLVRRATASGVPLPLAVRAASWNTARYFRLPRRGAIAPGYFADMTILRDVVEVTAGEVFVAGRRIAAEGRLDREIPAPAVAREGVTGTVTVPELTAADLCIPFPAGSTAARVIVPVPNQIITREKRLKPPVREGCIVADPAVDLAKLFCVGRHNKGGRCATALVQGFGLERGALAISVAHDHHNIIGVGVADEDILCALRRIGEMDGGIVAVVDGVVRAELPLPIAGLLSEQNLWAVRDAMRELDAAAIDLGVTMPAPFMALSFLGLPVIPALKLTDHGLVDVAGGRVVPVAVGDGE